MKAPSTSHLLGYAATILTGVLSALGDTHALALANSVLILVNAVFGVLAAAHVVGAKWLDATIATIERDLHVSAASTKAQAANAQAAAQAASLVQGLHAAVNATGAPTP